MIVVSCIRCHELFETTSVHESVPAHCRTQDREFCRGSGYTGNFQAFAPQVMAMRPSADLTAAPLPPAEQQVVATR